MAAKALSGMRRCIPALQAPYFHMASLSMVLLLMILCAGCTSDDEVEAPVPPQGQESTAPVATILFPGASALLTSAPITVRGTAQDQSTITGVAVNGVPATSTDGFATWVAQVTIPLGMSEVVVSTTDAVGNTEARAAVAMLTVVETLYPFQQFGSMGMAVEASGTLIIADGGGPVAVSNGRLTLVGVTPGAVVRVNPRTGARTIISDATTGSGPALGRPILHGAIAVEASGAFVVSGSDPSTSGRLVLVRVDPRTGAQTIISDGTTGGWPPGFFADSIAIEATGTFVVAGGFPAAVVRVDPLTGAQTIVSDATTGSGPQLGLIRGIAVEARGALVVASAGPLSVMPLTLMRVDPLTGARSIIANTTDSGPHNFSTQSIAIEATGTFVVAGSFPAVVMRVDPLTGAQTIVSDATTGSGPGFGSGVLTGIVVEPTGDLVVIDEEQDTVVRVDPATGHRTVISANAVIGSGPAVLPSGIAASATGTLFVTGPGQLVQLDPHTGMRRAVAKMADVFTDMAVEATGTVIGVSHMPDLFCGFITRIDPTTGRRNPVVLKGCPTTVAVEATGSLVVAFVDPFPQTTLMRLDPHTLAGTPIVASLGPTLPRISSIAVEPTGTFVVVDPALNAVARINEQTGERTIISDATTGSGPMFQYLGNIEVEATGDLVTVDPVRKAVFRINPVTGARTIVSDATIGRGPAFFKPSEIAVEPTGTLVVADTELGAVVRVDPLSGDRAIISR